MQRRRTEIPSPISGWDQAPFFIQRHHPGFVLFGLFCLSATGIFQNGLPILWKMGIWTGGVLWVLGSLMVRYLRRAATDRKSQIEVLSLLILGINALTQLTGGLTSSLTLLYVFLALLAALLCDIEVNTYTIAAIFLLEGINLWVNPQRPADAGGRALIWAAGLSLIPLVVKGYLRVERQEKDELRTAVLRFKTSEQVFRPLTETDRVHQVWALTPAVREKSVALVTRRFDEAIENLFWLFKGALPQTHHCILFMPGETGAGFLLQKWVGGDSRELRAQSVITEGEGVIGFAIKERRLYNAKHLISDPGALDYCTRAVRIQSLIVNPLVQKDRVEGVLIVDSLKAEAFNEEEEQLFLRLSSQVLQAIENRREHQSIQSHAQELDTLVAVSESLGSKLDLEHRLETMADKIKEIIPYDHCFIFLVELGERCAELKVVRGFSDDHLVGQMIPLHEGFLSLVVKRRAPIMKVDLHERERGKGIFPLDTGIKLRPASFLALPMIVQDRVIGIFAITSQRPGAFDQQHKEFLRMLCSQAAVSIADAKLHDEVNRLATMDGLTGIANHRRFQERLNEEFERQARDTGRFALVMVDVDHFKKVNDRFGHPVGDQVLKQVAAVLLKTVRKVDVVARYGGEEFAVILLNSGPKESYQLAERVRKAVEGISPVINGEPLKITISLGMAVYPDDALDRETLIERADRALYAAKNSGRNQTCVYSKI
ncbi:MAG: diguanylate cyclase [Nitrospirae bacterium]|nr:diguanylate cyclase [Nitrospirota bacterium]